MRLDLLRFALAAVLALSSVSVTAPRAHAQDAPAADESQEDREPCDGKARLRGPVFARGSGNIEPATLPALDFVAEQIKARCAGKVIMIEGYTDTGGDPAYNKRLSEVRAREIKRLLVERGVPDSQLETVGYGESRPLSTGNTPEDHALNRRITFVAKDSAAEQTE
jgi:outer membrane protein OmpA-like peptidoglycan-associated protein